MAPVRQEHVGCAVHGLTTAMAFLDALGYLDEAHDGVAGKTQVVLGFISAAYSTWWECLRELRRRPGRHGAGGAHLALAATSAPEIDALRFTKLPIMPAVASA